jgi:hypothetical protein
VRETGLGAGAGDTNAGVFPMLSIHQYVISGRRYTHRGFLER